MADRSGYIGRAPGDSSVTVARQTFSPTGVTTDFTFASGYTVGYLDLFLNGAKLIEGVDYNATDASTISLVSAAINGDVLEGVAYKAFNLGDGSRIGIQSAGTLVGNVNTLNFIGAGNTFALNGGTIDVSITGAGGTWSNYDTNTGVTTSKKVKISNNLEVTGVTTSTGGFVGALTGNSATATVATNAQGLTGTPDIAVRNITGVAATFTGVLTYEDVTNIDSIGIITAQSDVVIADKIIHLSDTNTAIRFPAADTFTVETGGSEAIRVDSSQRLLVNTATTRTNYDNGSVSSNLLHVERTAASGNAGISICANAATAADAGSILYMGRTKATSNGATNVVADNDLIARISFQGADGSELVEAASIRVDVDGTPGANDMPGRIEFHTTSDGAGGATERLRIDSSGRLLAGLNASVDSNSTLQVEGRNTITAIRYSAATGNAGSKIELSRSASNTVGTTAAVSATDELGEIRFRGASTGSSFNTGASINAVVVSGTISASSFPTDLLFKTTSNGSASSTEKLRITSAGNVGINATSPGDKLSVSGGNIGIYNTGNNHGSLYFYKDNVATAWFKYRGDTNAVIIGTNAGDKVTIDSSGNLTATGNVTAYSDISLKENIETIPNALDKVLNLRGVEFDRIDKEDNTHEIGVIAQEVEEVIPEVVLTNTEGIKSVAYGNLVGLLIESIKELKAEINDLKAQVEG